MPETQNSNVNMWMCEFCSLALWRIVIICWGYFPPPPPFLSGGTIHMVCRNWERAEKAREDICRETGNKVSLKEITMVTQGCSWLAESCACALISAGLRPSPGHVWDSEDSRICRVVQEEVQVPERAGEHHRRAFLSLVMKGFLGHGILDSVQHHVMRLTWQVKAA